MGPVGDFLETKLCRSESIIGGIINGSDGG